MPQGMGGFATFQPSRATVAVPKPYELTEHQIQAQILDWLKLKRIFHYRNNSGAIKKGAHMVRFGWPGSPDIVAVVAGRYVGIEIKRANGVQSQQQFFFARELEKAGGRYILCRSLEDAIRQLAEGSAA